MKYRVQTRSYVPYTLRPFFMVSSGMHDISDAIALAQRIRMLAPVDCVGVDVWLVPV